MPDQPLLQDGGVDFLGGQDASKIPARVPADSYYAGVNVQVSKGVPGPRWGFHKRRISFPEGGVTNPISNTTVPYEELFYGGRFQAAFAYSFGGKNYILFVVAGRIFLVDINTYKASVIAIQGGGNLNEYAPRINWSNAGNYIVLFDFPNVPIIFDGVTARRSNLAALEVPISTLGVYNQNRLFIANAGNEFTAGDPTGNLATPQAPITFNEVEAEAAAYFGQIFQLPTNYQNNINDPITAMATLQFNDNSTGIGPLLVATKNYVYSYAAQTPRNTWEAGTFGTLFIFNAGVAGPRAHVNVNSDWFFLSADNQVRTASMSRDEQKKWSHVPISREVANYLKCHDEKLLSYAVLGYFQNKIFISTNPFRVGAFDTNRKPIFDVANAGLVVISTDNLANLERDGKPAWDGLWTGVRPMEMVTVGNRFFIVSKDSEYRNELYEVDPDTTYDSDGSDLRYNTSHIYTREHSFENSIFQNKSAHSLDVAMQQVQGDFKLDVSFRPSHATNFKHWGTFEHIAPWRMCNVPVGCQFNGLAPHNFSTINFGQPLEANACDTVSRTDYSVFRLLQLKFSITGKDWELQAYRAKATLLPQTEQINTCQEFFPVQVCKECNTDWDIGPFKSCQSPQT